MLWSDRAHAAFFFSRGRGVASRCCESVPCALIMDFPFSTTYAGRRLSSRKRLSSLWSRYLPALCLDCPQCLVHGCTPAFVRKKGVIEVRFEVVRALDCWICEAGAVTPERLEECACVAGSQALPTDRSARKRAPECAAFRFRDRVRAGAVS
jgi:hypothetical protein